MGTHERGQGELKGPSTGSALRRLGRLGLAAGVAGLAGLGAAPAQASPQDVIGFGARASALGATGTASAEGYEAVYANPALLSLAHERSLTFGLVGAHFDLHARERISYSGLKGTLIGAVLPIPFGGILKDRITLGLGFFAPLDLVVRARSLYPETPQFSVADRTQSVAVQAGLGVDLGHGLRLGGGFAALAALQGSVGVATDASGRVGSTVGDTLVASYGPVVGATFDLGESYRVGLTFRGKLAARFDVVITAKDLGDITVPPLNISGTAQYDPWQLALELAKVKGPWKLAAALVYKHWSAYPGGVDATVQCPTTDPATGQPFTGACDPLLPPAPGYSDTVSPRIGAERSFDAARGVTMRLRAGALLEPSPAPEQIHAPNQYDSSRTALTLGYGLSLSGSLPHVDLDLFGQVHALSPRTHTKGPDVPAANPGVPSVTTGGVIVAGGATAGVRF